MRDQRMETAIPVRAALVTYVLQRLKIDKHVLNENPTALQIVLVNHYS